MALPHYNMIWWSLIVVCYAANLRDTLSLSELKETTSTSMPITVEDDWHYIYNYNVEPSDKLAVLRDLIYANSCFKDQGYRVVLKFGGNEELDFEQTFESFGIKENDKVGLVCVAPVLSGRRH